MSNRTYRDGVNPGYVVTFKIRYQCLDQTSIAPALAKLDALLGMQQLTLLEKQSALVLKYDASKIDLDQILEMLSTFNITPKSGWWASRKLSHYRFINQNVRDNSKHVPVCCSKPPPEVSRRLRQG